ncbi:DHH family phosphoesterase [Desulfovibrio inopinatus]|uniref:DHH family phosphoesterase n=1 Tax=Desulfovibrio inopinatus TaxID=102109 RepID=UPI00041612C8|nr:bifunctional oligoribonuclease/PAP phosphatase NrnA [Desulfovibrio inopinatus]
MSTIPADIADLLTREDNFLVAAHFNPDGDAIGATAALGFILSALGKQFQLYNATGIPPQFVWMALPGPLVTELPPADSISWIITLDSGDADRLGADLKALLPKKQSINIDHHLGNPEYGTLNWVDTTASSTGEMISRLADALGLALRGSLAEAIYTAMVTDTGGFRFSNTRPETMELAARMIRAGLNPGLVNAKIDNQWTMARIKLWSEVMSNVAMYSDGRIGVIRLPVDIFDRTGATRADCDGLINNVMRIRGVRVAMSLREDTDYIKFSLRSVGDVNVRDVAASFGGGGHKNAAGGQIVSDLETAQAQLLEAVEPIATDGV